MKVFISVSKEETMYRGEGYGSNSSLIEWITPDKQHAEGYASYREGNVREVGIDLDKERIVSMSHDSMILTPREFTTRVLRQVPRKRVSDRRTILIAAQERFLKHFNVERRIPVMDYWTSEDDKKAVHDFLTSFGFTCIRVQESKNRVETYGRLKN